MSGARIGHWLPMCFLFMAADISISRSRSMSRGARNIRIERNSFARVWKIAIGTNVAVHQRATQCTAWTRYAFDELTASLSHSRKAHRRHLQSELFVLLFLGEKAPLFGQPFSHDGRGTRIVSRSVPHCAANSARDDCVARR